jgi:ArsR family transcriptional regulator, lead/cadmium/zinc/bismuth-responsive transcriptional repressor
MIPNPLHPGGEETCDVRMVHLERVGRARDEALDEDRLERMARTFKVLGDPNRLRMVLALQSGEMCVCDLAAFLGVSESAVSHQLRQLRDLALVKRRRAGQILYYSLDDDHVAELLKLAEEHMDE